MTPEEWRLIVDALEAQHYDLEEDPQEFQPGAAERHRNLINKIHDTHVVADEPTVYLKDN